MWLSWFSAFQPMERVAVLTIIMSSCMVRSRFTSLFGCKLNAILNTHASGESNTTLPPVPNPNTLRINHKLFRRQFPQRSHFLRNGGLSSPGVSWIWRMVFPGTRITTAALSASFHRRSFPPHPHTPTNGTGVVYWHKLLTFIVDESKLMFIPARQSSQLGAQVKQNPQSARICLREFGSCLSERNVAFYELKVNFMAPLKRQLGWIKCSN